VLPGTATLVPNASIRSGWLATPFGASRSLSAGATVER
jgi:hypothetical protein